MKLTQEQIQTLETISRKAGAAILDIYREENFGVEQKADDSPLTRADKASNQIICAGLQALTPKLPIISEENTIPAFEVRKYYQAYWLIDPLDGTKEFIKRNGDFTTNIALIVNGKSAFGMVFAPVLDQLYYAQQGDGAYKITKDGKAQLTVRSFDESQEGLVITCSRSHLNVDTTDYINKYSNPKLHKVGSSLKLMMVAEGSADIYPRLGPISEWDIAASHIIVEEAGGRLYQYPSGASVIYNKENILMPYFVAEGRKMKDEGGKLNDQGERIKD